MSSGLLQFTLSMNGEGFSKAIQTANSNVKGFQTNISSVSNRTEDMALTVSQHFGKLRESTAAANEGMRALGGTMEMVGYSVAPQFTMAMRTAVETLRAFRSAAIATELGFGSLSLAASGLAAALFTVFEGYKALRAELAEIASEDALEKQFEFLRAKLIPQLDRMVKLGRLDKNQVIGIKNQLIVANTPELQKTALAAAQSPLKQIGQDNALYTARGTLKDFLSQLSPGLLEGAAREKAQASLQFDKQISEAMQLAQKAGLKGPEMDNITSFFNRLVTAEYKHIDERYKKSSASGHNQPPQLRPQHFSGLEQMGFVFKTGAGMGKETAQETVARIRETNAILAQVLNTLKENTRDVLQFSNAPAI